MGTGNTEVYLLDGMTALGVFTVNGSGSVVASYFNVLAGDKVVGRQPSTGNRRYYHTDLLGSTRAVVEGAGVVESFDFDPWGLLMPGRTLAGPTKEGFTSKERDAESGLDYFGARYYMAALGRWTTVDPLADTFPQWSPYAYALNNPAILVDPDGRCSRPSGIKGGKVGICIGLFIAGRRIGGLGYGDNREPVGDDPRATYRAQTQLVIDPLTGEIESAETRPGLSRAGAFGIEFQGQGSAEAFIGERIVDREGNTQFSLSITAQNGFAAFPIGPDEPINMTIRLVVTPEGKVGIVGGTRDGYPSLEIFAYGSDGSMRRIIFMRENDSDDLAPPEEQEIYRRRPM